MEKKRKEKETIGLHRGIGPTGETTYKRTTSSALEDAIEIGMTHTVGRLSQDPERDIQDQDFEESETVFFPAKGSYLTPAHPHSDFKFKMYAPMAFHYFRDIFEIGPNDYLHSLFNRSLIALSDPAASGSVFYVSSDDKFIIKTVPFKEAEFLQKLLPRYYTNLIENKETFLPKFYGLYCVQTKAKKIRFVIMNNLIPCGIRVHLKFDLKGSWKRTASSKEIAKATPTYKDLDFITGIPEGLLLDADKHSALSESIRADCLVLQSLEIMDYSLLVGVHNLDRAIREHAREEAEASSVGQRKQSQRSIAKLAMATLDQMGGILARNTRGDRLLVYVGIIDILQSYTVAKKLEHYVKSAIHDGNTVSVSKPSFYSERFQKFMCNRVFRTVTFTPSSKMGRVGNYPGLTSTENSPIVLPDSVRETSNKV